MIHFAYKTLLKYPGLDLGLEITGMVQQVGKTD